MTNRISAWVGRWLGHDAPIRHRAACQNIYHCTVQKSASQWIRRILSDARTHRACGLTSYQYQNHLPGGFDPRKLTERRFAEAFPPGTIATPLYIDYEGYAAIPKPERSKAFFVMRDPRDVLVSWYFSCRYSHRAVGDLGLLRDDLSRLSESDGLLYALDHLRDYGLFAAQRSWVDAPTRDADVLLVQYEDLIGPDHLAAFENLMGHCDIRMARSELAEVLAANSFEVLSGRAPGQEDARDHYRKGVAGDWRNHFDDRVQARFDDATGGLLAAWKYQ